MLIINSISSFPLMYFHLSGRLFQWTTTQEMWILLRLPWPSQMWSLTSLVFFLGAHYIHIHISFCLYQLNFNRTGVWNKKLWVWRSKPSNGWTTCNGMSCVHIHFSSCCMLAIQLCRLLLQGPLCIRSSSLPTVGTNLSFCPPYSGPHIVSLRSHS